MIKDLKFHILEGLFYIFCLGWAHLLILNFPFLEINKEFAQIPLNYREFAPRKHDDKWEEKFEWLANGVPKMLSQMNADGIDENYIIDYEKYHKLYFNLMKKYWEIDIFWCWSNNHMLNVYVCYL